VAMEKNTNQNQNQRNLRRLLVSVKASYGKLNLLIAICDNQQYRDELISSYEKELEANGTSCHRVRIDHQQPSLKQSLHDLVLRESALRLFESPAIVTVLGADELLGTRINEAKSAQEQFFFSVQWTRESLRDFTFPIVIWFTSAIANELSQQAPDFWSWRGGMFEFLSPTTTDPTPQVIHPLTNEVIKERQIKVDPTNIQKEIDELLARDPNSRLLASLFGSLGQAYQESIRFAEAESSYKKALELYEMQLDVNAFSFSNTLKNLAELYKIQGRYSEAEPLIHLARLGSYDSIAKDFKSRKVITWVEDVFKMKVKIAVAGHTNVGKTTLIRTLTRSNFGKVEDRANVTVVPEPCEYEGMQALFIDCPGFSNSSSYVNYNNVLKALKGQIQSIVDQALSGFDREAMQFDERALEGIDGSDVVLYVTDLESVPQKHHEDELTLVRAKSSKIVAVVNKFRVGELKSTSREKSWKQFFIEQKIENFLVLDAFWDSPSKINRLNQLILNLLKDDQSKFELFKKGLEDLQKRQESLSNMISLQFAECLVLCSNIYHDRSGDIKSLESKIRIEFTAEIEKNVMSFIGFASQLYTIAADNPTEFISEEYIKLKVYSKPHEAIGHVAAYAGLGSGVWATVGAAAGGISGLFFGGVGAVPGAVLGAQAGTVAGSFIGVLAGISSPDDKNLAIKVSPEILERVAEICLAYVWAYAYYGFGNKLEDRDNPKINIDLINKLREQKDGTRQFCQSNKIDFISATKEDIAKWCNSFFQELESR